MRFAALDQQERAFAQSDLPAVNDGCPCPGDNVQPLVSSAMAVVRTPFAVPGGQGHLRRLGVPIAQENVESSLKSHLFAFHLANHLQARRELLIAGLGTSILEATPPDGLSILHIQFHASGEKNMARYGSSAQREVKKAIHKTKRGTQRSGKGGKAKSRKQAIAIGLSKARKKGAKVPPKKSRS